MGTKKLPVVTNVGDTLRHTQGRIIFYACSFPDFLVNQARLKVDRGKKQHQAPLNYAEAVEELVSKAPSDSAAFSSIQQRVVFHCYVKSQGKQKPLT